MQERLEALSSTLYAQVRDAGPTHGYDLEGYLRPKAHPANIATVYLGDVAQTLLKVMQGVSTPTMQKNRVLMNRIGLFHAVLVMLH